MTSYESSNSMDEFELGDGSPLRDHQDSLLDVPVVYYSTPRITPNLSFPLVFQGTEGAVDNRPQDPCFPNDSTNVDPGYFTGANLNLPPCDMSNMSSQNYGQVSLSPLPPTVPANAQWNPNAMPPYPFTNSVQAPQRDGIRKLRGSSRTQDLVSRRRTTSQTPYTNEFRSERTSKRARPNHSHDRGGVAALAAKSAVTSEKPPDHSEMVRFAQRWKEKNPRKFPTDDQVQTVAHICPGFVNLLTLRECFENCICSPHSGTAYQKPEKPPYPSEMTRFAQMWKEKNPGKFPTDTQVQTVAHMCSGSVNFSTMRECFEDCICSSEPPHFRTAHQLPDSPPSQNHRGEPTPSSSIPEESQKKFSCQICNKAFIRKYDCKRHEQRTHKPPQFPCHYCGKYLKRKDKLNDHVRTQHSGGDPGGKARKPDTGDPDDEDGDGGDGNNMGPSGLVQRHDHVSNGSASAQTSSSTSNSYPGTAYTYGTAISYDSSNKFPSQESKDTPLTYANLPKPNHSTSLFPTSQRGYEDDQNFYRRESLPLPVRTLGTLGRGAWGSVDAIRIGGRTSQDIARKSITLRSRASLRRSILNEAKIMGSLRHQNIVPLIGTYSTVNTFNLLLPLADCDLKSILHSPPNSERLGQANMSLWVSELMSAVAYLHSPPVAVVHGDLKPANILVYRSHVRIADFGSASFQGQTPRSVPITKIYAPPEATQGSGLSTAADVFSLGCVFVEISTVLVLESLAIFEHERSSLTDGKRDSSFQGHLPHVLGWISNLRSRASNAKFVRRTLNWCEKMLKAESAQRPQATDILDDIEHSSCSTCSHNSSHSKRKQSRGNHFCNKCTSLNLPSIEKFRDNQDVTESFYSSMPIARQSHISDLQVVLRDVETRMCPSGRHMLHTFNSRNSI